MHLSISEAYQLFIDGIVNGSGYAMLSAGFGMIIHVTGRFHVAYAVIYAMTGFVATQVAISYHMDFIEALVLGVMASVVIAGLIERFIYEPLTRRAGAAKLFIVFIASLGINTAGQSVLGLIWPNAISANDFNITRVQLGSAVTTNLGVISVATAWVALCAVWAVVRWSKLGLMIRAVRVNPDLGLEKGIDPRRIYLSVFAIATILGGLNAVFVTTQSAPASDMGQTRILYAVIAAFVAGPSASILTIAALGLLIGLIGSLSELVVSQGWSSVVIFTILLIYVMVRAGATVNWALMFRRFAFSTRSPAGGELEGRRS